MQFEILQSVSGSLEMVSINQNYFEWWNDEKMSKRQNYLEKYQNLTNLNIKTIHLVFIEINY